MGQARVSVRIKVRYIDIYIIYIYYSEITMQENC